MANTNQGQQTESCIPCQVILWDQQAVGMIQGVSQITSLSMQGAKTKFNNDWATRWYQMLYRHCDEMKAMIDELTGISES